jgi:hypothetical protein
MAAKGTETAAVRRQRADEEDDFYGDEAAAEDMAGVAVLDRCIVWPRASSSGGERGLYTIEGLHIFVPHGEIVWDPALPLEEQELRPEDKVTIRGEDWQLESAVGDWRKKRGNRVGYLFEVGRWSG